MSTKLLDWLRSFLPYYSEFCSDHLSFYIKHNLKDLVNHCNFHCICQTLFLHSEGFSINIAKIFRKSGIHFFSCFPWLTLNLWDIWQIFTVSALCWRILLINKRTKDFLPLEDIFFWWKLAMNQRAVDGIHMNWVMTASATGKCHSVF